MAHVPITGIILAGGRGTRLYPLTKSVSKQLLLVGNTPMILRVIHKMRRAGIVSIVVVIDERNASEFMELLRDGSEFDVEIVYVWQNARGEGMPAAIAKAQKAVKNDKIFVACGDVMFDADIREQINAYVDQPAEACIIYTNTSDTAGYSELVTQGERVVDILPKNKEVHNAGAIDLGMYLYPYEVFNRIEKLTVSARGETEIWDLNASYIKENQMTGKAIQGWWSDAGANIEEYVMVDRHYGNRE